MSLNLRDVDCKHDALNFESSPNAAIAGFKTPTKDQRMAAIAANVQRNLAERQGPNPGVCPAPLVLPGDDLSLDPHCTAQSMRSWIRLRQRNKVTPERSTIYLAAPPRVKGGDSFIIDWTRPETVPGNNSMVEISSPDTNDVLDYLKAFYDGLSVKFLPSSELCFSSWDSEISKENPSYIGLNTSKECIGIRNRASIDGVFKRQLNLDDLLEAAIDVLPEDAYALLLLVDHDLYEDDSDIFVCGRAYGSSRVAVVSTARYHPSLDSLHDVEREHMWPASHCEKYMKSCYIETSAVSKIRKKHSQSQPGGLKPSVNGSAGNKTVKDTDLALRSAVSAHIALPPLNHSSSLTVLSGLWLGRICRTASHELGHCLGIGHCAYYACSMQGSASLAEDTRQPPYLCPVDLAKVLHATGTDEGERDKALVAFCDKHKEVHMFAAFAAWTRSRRPQDMWH